MTQDDHGSSIFGALLVGVIGGAAAVILSDRAKRQRLGNTLKDWLDTGQEKLEDTTNRGRKQLAHKLDDISEKLEPDTKR